MVNGVRNVHTISEVRFVAKDAHGGVDTECESPAGGTTEVAADRSRRRRTHPEPTRQGPRREPAPHLVMGVTGQTRPATRRADQLLRAAVLHQTLLHRRPGPPDRPGRPRPRRADPPP